MSLTNFQRNKKKNNQRGASESSARDRINSNSWKTLNFYTHQLVSRTRDIIIPFLAFRWTDEHEKAEHFGNRKELAHYCGRALQFILKLWQEKKKTYDSHISPFLRAKSTCPTMAQRHVSRWYTRTDSEPNASLVLEWKTKISYKNLRLKYSHWYRSA